MVNVKFRDNRGSEDVQFGFVYFEDDRRVGYTTASGVVPNATGGWGPITPEHVRAAVEFLKNDGFNG
jgi:hypothetical protein